ncbi:MAG: DUF2752 domain-containing protein [Flavobacteriales bacterium]|nr:DUF2752 domain-containing protein [Flavobacteriales bacterium]
MRRWGWWLAGAGILFSLVRLYMIDPEKGGFLSCPFRLFTGLLCPGCGSQRALHDLMHLRTGEAFDHNALLVISIPLLVLQWACSHLFFKEKPLSARNWVVFSWAVLAVGWGLFRNVYVSPHTGH